MHALVAPVVLSVAALVLMMQIAFWRNALISWILSCASFLVAIALLLPQLDFGASPVSAQLITPILVADQYSVFFSLLILFASLVTSVLAKDYLHIRTGENEEFYLLLILSTLGALILVSATHLASFLLGLELLGVALYALIAYPERGHSPLEAAVKYLILSGAASAILLFGFALIYAALGTLSFAGIGAQLSNPDLLDNNQSSHLIILLGTAMVFTGIGFKLSVVPFHMWTPDVYQGAPAPVTGFLATVSKGAIFAALLRFFVDAELYQYHGLMQAISALAIASMLVGNLLALKQDNLKRLLAYSSIAHLGYLLVTLVVYSSSQQPGIAVEAVGFYLTAYVITSVAAFALVSILSSSGVDSSGNFDPQEADSISVIEGLFWRQPMLALMLTISMLSLAGIPLTVGFVGKFYLIAAGISAGLWMLLAALVVGSGIGIYYYLRIIFSMTQKADSRNSASLSGKPSASAMSMIWLLIAAMLYFGIFPQPLIEYLSFMVL
jgi:NADH-quinone oxidoreductase subunit N